MSTTLFLIFNHLITKRHRGDARVSLYVERIVDLPPDLKERWCNIPPDLPRIATYIEPIKQWLESQAAERDYVLIQGDFGACYLMIGFAFDLGLVPVYSTTLREVVEEQRDDGSVRLTHSFKHRMFRRYGS